MILQGKSTGAQWVKFIKLHHITSTWDSQFPPAPYRGQGSWESQTSNVSGGNGGGTFGL